MKISDWNFGVFGDNEKSGRMRRFFEFIKSELDNASEPKSAVTSSLLRDILPKTMNYQFSSDFHPLRAG